MRRAWAWAWAWALAWLAAGAAGEAVVSRGWRPTLGLDAFKPFVGGDAEGVPTALAAASGATDQCALYKVAFNQELYFQYVQYKADLPDILQFTLCAWTKFSNNSNDHPIFSYAVPDQPRAIFSWVANTQRASYLSMAVNGHTFYRLNYPFRLHRWYHSCQSWNGKTGEWQAWVNAERVGRGFHNRLVGHVIPGGGVALSGQEQRQPGGGFLEGPGAPRGAGGMLGELTLLHLYAAALAPGKAHRDHKHHHGNHYETNPKNGVSPNAPPLPSVGSTLAPVPQFMSPFLVGGQLAPSGHHVAAQLAGLTRPRCPQASPARACVPQGYRGGLPLPAAAPTPATAAATISLFPAGLAQHQLFKRQQSAPADEGEGDGDGEGAAGGKSKRQVSQLKRNGRQTRNHQLQRT
ncbi:Uncharacterized protein GBIM_18118 [Gryllus bimaculatus]|nr:Uncharacterized protein GBIM_18118 [Gryllus bimaculatus]